MSGTSMISLGCGVAIATSVIAALVASPPVAAEIRFKNKIGTETALTPWKTKDKFLKRECNGDDECDDAVPDFDLSGAACADASFCLMASDETRYVVPFALRQPNEIVVKHDRRIHLLPTNRKKKVDELDLEAVAFDGERFVIAGSHSVKRGSGCIQASRHWVFQLKTKAAKNRKPCDCLYVPPAKIKQVSLDYAFSVEPVLRNTFNLPLQLNGLNVEGAASDGKTVYIGMRAPSFDGQVYVFAFDRKDLFKGKRPRWVVHPISVEPRPIGKRDSVKPRGIGIRDMARLPSGGFLLLTGDAEAAQSHKKLECDPYPYGLGIEHPDGRDRGNPFELYFWDGSSRKARRVGEFLKVPKQEKLETILVLPEPWSDRDAIHVLTWRDRGGVEHCPTCDKKHRNGAPASLALPRALLQP